MENSNSYSELNENRTNLIFNKMSITDNLDSFVINESSS